jgi:hypothetical protein
MVVKSFSTDALKWTLYAAISFQPFDHFVIANQWLSSPLFKRRNILGILCKGFSDGIIDKL